MKEGRGKKHNGFRPCAASARPHSEQYPSVSLLLFLALTERPISWEQTRLAFFPLPLVVSLGREASLRKVSISHPRGISFKAPLYYLPRGNICALTRFGLYSLFGVTPLPQTNHHTTKLQDPPMSGIVHSNRLIALRMKAHRK